MDPTKPINMPQRLKFIDLARTIAILLMLEGHFVGLTLMADARDPSHPVYAAWNFIRGFTAPLFFTVAGMIFVFLLAGEEQTAFFQRIRVRKGLRRAAELLGWGYVLQLSVRHVPNYLQGEFEDWVFAFHVLQCIGVGLIFLLLIAAVQRMINRIPLTLFYSIALVACLVLYLWIKSLPEGTHVPAGWPQLIQNALSGPRSVFPIAPWLCFAFLGGAMGAYVRRIHHEPATPRSCLWFFGLAAALKLLWLAAVIIPMSRSSSEAIAWFTGRAAEVVMFLGLLRLVEIRFGIGLPRFLRIGRETFAVYILHVIVLYGGLFGLGLNRMLKETLNAWQAAGGALLFMAFFATYAILLNLRKTRKTK
ncbi:MAG: hypothetical protein RL346_422 [Verrucomicrobiota bacterium]|jgi:uncharacterized membrane protein